MDVTDIKITETPRDALQGINKYIPAHLKAAYINLLLRSGFQTVEVGSFVSKKVIPQMADTEEVLQLLDMNGVSTSIMILVSGITGAIKASKYDIVRTIAYPYALSDTFLSKNMHTDKVNAFNQLVKINELALSEGKEMRVFLSMAYGNPYGDTWNRDLLFEETGNLIAAGITQISLSDTVGQATPEILYDTSRKLIGEFDVNLFSLHLHTRADNYFEKLSIAHETGFRHFETAVGGFGGCPMSGCDLMGNLNTFSLLDWCSKKGISHSVDIKNLQKAHQNFLQLV